MAADAVESVTLALSDALEYAAHGKQAVGYALLIRGLTRAERLLEAGSPWAPQLLRAWCAAIDRYCERVADLEDAEESANQDEMNGARGR